MRYLGGGVLEACDHNEDAEAAFRVLGGKTPRCLLAVRLARSLHLDPVLLRDWDRLRVDSGPTSASMMTFIGSDGKPYYPDEDVAELRQRESGYAAKRSLLPEQIWAAMAVETAGRVASGWDEAGPEVRADLQLAVRGVVSGILPGWDVVVEARGAAGVRRPARRGAPPQIVLHPRWLVDVWAVGFAAVDGHLVAGVRSRDDVGRPVVVDVVVGHRLVPAVVDHSGDRPSLRLPPGEST